MLSSASQSHPTEAQYYSLQGLCRAAQAQRQQVRVVGWNNLRGVNRFENYDPVRRSWEGTDLHTNTGGDRDQPRLFVGDGCLFMINKACAELCKFRPSSGHWDTVTTKGQNIYTVRNIQ